MTALATPSSTQPRTHSFITRSPKSYEENVRTSTEMKRLSQNASPQQRRPLAVLSERVQNSVKLESKELPRADLPTESRSPSSQFGEASGKYSIGSVPSSKRESSTQTVASIDDLKLESNNATLDSHNQSAIQKQSTSTESPDRTVLLNIFTPDYSTIKSAGCSGSSTATSSPPSSSGSPSQYTRSPPTSRSNSSSQESTKEYKEPPRKRRRTSPDELQILEYEFARNSRPCKVDRERIASLTSKDEKAVQVWFQNKRQSCRRQQNGSGMIPALVRSISYHDEYGLSGSHSSPGMIPAVHTQSMPTIAINRPSSSRPPFGTPGGPSSAEAYTPSSVTHMNHNPVATPQSHATGIPSPITHPAMAYFTGLPALSTPTMPSMPSQHTQMVSSGNRRNQDSQAHNGGSPINYSPLCSHDGVNTPASTDSSSARRSKSLKLSMSADGKAEIVERSPLKVINTNRMPLQAQRSATTPTLGSILSGYEQECASSLLVLKAGHW